MIFSNEDSNLINTYIDYYGGPTKASRAPLGEILGEWAKAKQNLLKMFGGNLILSKPFTFVKTESQLLTDFSHRSSWTINLYLNNLDDKIWEYYSGENRYIWEHLHNNLLTREKLITNIYQGGTFSFTLPNGKKYKINNGAKIMRILHKLTEVFGLSLDSWQRLCDLISIISTDKFMTGTLHLSIHPLDYLTMSDNQEDWDSCMSWRNEGGYHAGTIEMMNSPYVVVGYFTLPDHTMTIGDGEWNSKTWRNLFIINDEIITGVRAYPFQSDALTLECLNWLKELSPYTYLDQMYIMDAESNVPSLPNKQIDFETGHMYNDMGRNYNYYYTNDAEAPISINYSGPLTCINCGCICDMPEDDITLCENCNAAFYEECSCCGNTIYNEDDLYEVDGEFFCQNCFDEQAVYCEIEDEYHLERNCTVFVCDNNYLYIYDNDTLNDFLSDLGYTRLSQLEWNSYTYTVPYEVAANRDMLTVFGLR